MSLRDFPDLIKHLPQHKPWVITISVISVTMVLAVCGFSSWQLLRADAQPIGLPDETPTVEYRDIDSREADPNPLTIEDVFPSVEIPAAEPDWPPYTMMGEPHVSEDCSVVADGEVKRVLAASGCSQVLRASFASGDNLYFATAGVLNLPDATVAKNLSAEIKGLVESRQGRFLGYVSVPDANRQLYTAPPHLAWEVRGHFLLYAVVVRQDSGEMTPGEADYVVEDLVKAYLRGTVIERWALAPESTEPDPAAADPSAAAEPSEVAS